MGMRGVSLLPRARHDPRPSQQMSAALPLRWVPGPYVFKHYEWREPGDPPRGTLVRHEPLAKPIKYDSLTPEIELELVRRYREDGDLDALDWLVGAHRPMVVGIAKHLPKGNIPLRALVEYGLIGVRIAAQPSRPSLTKKGKLVGFDPSLGHRFSTYARAYARKEMTAALSGEESPALAYDFAQKVGAQVEDWVDTPTEEDCRNEHADWPAEFYGAGPDPAPFLLEWLWYARLGISHLRRRRWQYCCHVAWTLWSPPDWAKDQARPRKVRLRNYKQHPRTGSELANKDTFYGVWRGKIESFEKVAEEGMEGFESGVDPEDSEDHMDYAVASVPRSHTLEGEQFNLPLTVLRQRWRYGCKRQGKIIPFSTNQGPGQFDKCGHPLPDYSHLTGEVAVNRNLPSVPFLCLKPLASIYLVGGEVTGVEGEVISRKRFWREPRWKLKDEEKQCLILYSQKCYLSGSLKALDKSYLISPKLGISRHAQSRGKR
jgi:hypothetical protein